MRVFEEKEFVKKDTIINPPPVYNEWQIYSMDLRDHATKIVVLVETVYEHNSVYEIYGMFLDEDQWYNVTIHLWKDPERREKNTYIRLVPWPESPISRIENIYREMVALLATSSLL